MNGKKVNRSNLLRCLLPFLVCLAAGVLVMAATCGFYPQEGTDVVKKSGATIDKSHADLGYILIKYKETKKAVKVRVVMGDTTLTYDLTPGADYTALPLQLGSGKYKITVYQQASGKKYTEQMSVTIKASIEDELSPFLCPNQYVWYTEESEAVKKAAEICTPDMTDKQKISAVADFLKRTLVYDYMAAMTVESGYIPDVDEVLSTGKGICFDYSALMCAMLRSQGVPCKLVIGYADTTYHAWVSVYLDGAWKRYDPTYASTGAKAKSYTTERWY